MSDATFDIQSPASKSRVLETLRLEVDGMLELASDPEAWQSPTACEGWELRDMIGHLVNATDNYLSGFEDARNGAGPPAPASFHEMAEAEDRAAKSFRTVGRDELLDRFSEGTNELHGIYESLTDAEWTGLMYPDPFFGHLPANIVIAGALGGICVHSWDIRQGRDETHSLRGDTADLLVPFVSLLWWGTADATAVTSPFSVGVRTTGVNGGDTRWDVSREGLQFGPGDLGGCSAVLEFDPGTLVLTAYGRVNGGTVRGDMEAAMKFRSLFVSI